MMEYLNLEELIENMLHDAIVESNPEISTISPNGKLQKYYHAYTALTKKLCRIM